MAESTLSLTHAELEADVGFYLGFGRGSNYGDTAWSTRQEQAITDSVKSGIRMFYFPTPLPGDMSSYDWSFMRPFRQLTLIDGESSVDLPDDFGGMDGDVRFVNSSRCFIPIKQTSDQNIAKLYANASDQVGQPIWCAIRQPATTSQTRGQRANLYIFPLADDDYTIEIQYYILPDSLSTSFPYALGGATHAETIKAACRATAELYQDNERGPMWAIFIDRMRASVSLDRRMKGQVFGYNSDPGYNRGRYNRYNDNYRVPITFNGSDPG